jgi:hypothetical protein
MPLQVWQTCYEQNQIYAILGAAGKIAQSYTSLPDLLLKDSVWNSSTLLIQNPAYNIKTPIKGLRS